MFRLAWMAALSVGALSLAPGRANDAGQSLGGRGAQCFFPPAAQLYERLRLTGAASVDGCELLAKRAEGGLLFDVTMKRRDGTGQVIWRAEVAVMELRSARDGKRLLMRLTNGRAWTNDGGFATWADRTSEVRLP
jgi:hypothetical protein